MPNVTQKVTQLIWASHIFHLRKPTDLATRRRGRRWFVGYELIGIEGCGNSELQALESFVDQFAAAWEWIASARDSELDHEARELKRKLRGLVASVEPAE